MEGAVYSRDKASLYIILRHLQGTAMYVCSMLMVLVWRAPVRDCRSAFMFDAAESGRMCPSLTGISPAAE